MKISEKLSTRISYALAAIYCIAALILIIYACTIFVKQNEEYNRETKYELVVLEKYDAMGLFFIMPQKVFFVKYKSRLITRSDREDYMVWKEQQSKISETTYQKLKTGQRIIRDSPYIE